MEPTRPKTGAPRLIAHVSPADAHSVNDVDLDVLPLAVSTGGGRSPVYVADHRGAPKPAVDRSPPFSRRPVVQHARWLVASAGPSGHSRRRSSSGCCVCLRKLLAVGSRPRRAAPMGWPRGGCPASSSTSWRDLARTIGTRQTIHIICGSGTSAVVRILGGGSSGHEHLRRLALTGRRPPVSQACGAERQGVGQTGTVRDGASKRGRENRGGNRDFRCSEQRYLALFGKSGAQEAVLAGLPDTPPIVVPFPRASPWRRLGWGVGKWLKRQGA